MLDMTGIPFVLAGEPPPDNAMAFELTMLTRDEVFPGDVPGPSLQEALRADSAAAAVVEKESVPAGPLSSAPAVAWRGDIGRWWFEAAPEEIVPVVLLADGSLLADASWTGLVAGDYMAEATDPPARKRSR